MKGVELAPGMRWFRSRTGRILFGISLLATMAAVGLLGRLVHVQGWAVTCRTIFSPAASARKPNAPRANPSIYRGRVELLRSLPLSEGAAVMVGSSTTQYGEWGEFFPQIPVFNRGVGGDTTSGALERVPDYLKNGPRQLFLLLGANDILNGEPVAAIVVRYSRLLQTIRNLSPHTAVYVQAVFPAPLLPGEAVSRLNRELARLAVGAGALFIDTCTPFRDAAGHPLPGLFLEDGLHLTPEGYRRWCDIIRPHLLKSSHYPAVSGIVH